MAKNITLRLDEAILRKCRHLAVEAEKSVSQWLTDLIIETLSKRSSYTSARAKAIATLEKGFALGGKPFSRSQTHER